MTRKLMLIAVLVFGLLAGAMVVADEACASYNCVTTTYTLTYSGPPFVQVITCRDCCSCSFGYCNCTRNCY